MALQYEAALQKGSEIPLCVTTIMKLSKKLQRSLAPRDTLRTRLESCSLRTTEAASRQRLYAANLLYLLTQPLARLRVATLGQRTIPAFCPANTP